jgi:hypothetical protein
VQRPKTAQLLALPGQLASLSDALVRMRETQTRAVQAAASRSAAEGLRAESDRRRGQLAGGPPRTSTHTVTADRRQGAGPVDNQPKGRPGPQR